MQQYNYTTGKNSTDSALIIDAMDILACAARVPLFTCNVLAVDVYLWVIPAILL